MTNLITVTINDNQEPVVSGRDLWEALEVTTPYTMWFNRMIDYGFTEGEDFCLTNLLSKQDEVDITKLTTLLN